MEQQLAGLRSESVPDLHGTSDVWQQILALDTRFGHLRPSMCGDSNMQRTLYLRRRHQLSKEQTRSSQVTHASHEVDTNAPKRDLYKCFREQLLISLYGHAPSLQFSSNTHSVEQSKSVAGSPKPESFSGSQYNKFTDDESCHSVGHTTSRAKETLAEGYAFSGIEHVFDHHTGAVNRIRFANNDNTRLAIASMDGTISICSTWPPSQAKRVLLLLSGGHQRGTSITDLAWSLSNDTLVSTALDGSVCLWDTASRSSSKFPSITSLSAHSWLSRETGDSYLLANAARLGLVLFQVTSSTGSLSMKCRFPIYHEPPDSHTNRSLRLLHSCFAPLVSFRSGACAVTASEDSNVYVFDVLYNGSHRSHCVSALPAGLVTVLQGHMAPVLDVAIAWDESVLASADEGGAVIVWRRLCASDEAIE
ncbi:WD domain, G-beta repeat protein, partial [Opisthorchis viverrini]